MNQTYKERAEAVTTVVTIPNNGGKSRDVALVTKIALLDIAAEADQQLASKDAEIAALAAEVARLKNAEANAAAGWDALRAENASLQAALVMAREYVESASRKRWDGTNNHKRAQLHLEALDHALAARKKG